MYNKKTAKKRAQPVVLCYNKHNCESIKGGIAVATREEQACTLRGGLTVYTGGAHRFGTDAFVLSGFAACRRKDIACDLGAGCGIIPLLLLGAESAPAQIYGLELQPDGVALMERAVAANGLEGRFLPLQGDLRRLPETLPKAAFDVVTCNPPYFRPGHGYQSPAEDRRTARQEDTCTLDDLCAAAAKLLKYGGRLCLCHRPERLADIFEAMRRRRIEPKRLRMVTQRQGTAPWLVLVEGRLGGNPALAIEADLVVEHPEGGFSDEMLALYGKTQRVIPPEKR